MTRLLWSVTILLAVLGVAAGVCRAVFVADLATRGEPARHQMMDTLGRDDATASQRAAELRRFDSSYANHPALTLLHVVPGAIFLALAPLQFVSRIRKRGIALHRWSGRFLIVVAFAGTASALFFGLFTPFGGPAEAAAIALFGGLFLTALGRAFVAVRRGQLDRHREWMIRAFAIAIGISTIRVIGLVFDLVLTPFGMPVKEGFVLTLWTGWPLMWGAAEWWIRKTRAAGAVQSAPATVLA